MSKKIRIVLAQLNLTVGDLAGNLQKHMQAAMTARDQLSADVIVFPELGLTGYPPEDLLLRPSFLENTQAALQEFIATIKDIYCFIGHPKQSTEGLYNACSLVYNGTIVGDYAKQHLPNYGMFDEYRYFIPGSTPCVVPIHGIRVGLVICEDVWLPSPIQQAVQHGAECILSPNASPFEVNKHDERVAILSHRAKQHAVPILYANLIGGQDGIIFDGGSMGVDGQGKISQCAGFFKENLLPIDLSMTDSRMTSSPLSLPNKEERIYQALVLSVRDYVEKNHFKSVVVGISGGIDSALTLAIAVDALGSEQVHAVMMLSRYTSSMSIDDAKIVAERLHIKLQMISIEPAYKSFLESLAPNFIGEKIELTEENIQARCRAVILMALSNKYGHLVLSTGNRSELAVGYCTLYGDMAGGFAVLKDVPKTLVYTLAHYRNQIEAVIPARIIARPPTAELAPNQKDEDALPPYPLLDQILEAYLNQSKSIEELIQSGFDSKIVHKVIDLIKKNEYKRCQIPLGPRINHQSFGRDWRYPVTNGFKG